MKTDIHNKDFALRLVLRERLRGTRQRPLTTRSFLGKSFPDLSSVMEPGGPVLRARKITRRLTKGYVESARAHEG